MPKLLISATLFLLLSLKALFALTLNDLKRLSTAAQSELQYNLRALNYDIGPVDGKIGRKSFAALKRFSDSNGQDLYNISLDELLKNIEQQAVRTLKKQKRNLPKTFDFKVTFEKPSQLKSLSRTALPTVTMGSVLMVSLQSNF